MPSLMVSGCGNIGSRLIQSLSNLDSGPYDIYGIEPYAQAWPTVQERFDQENKGGHTLHMMASPKGVPPQVDLLIVSVDARNRLAALETALAATTPKAILLEKILFTKPEDYAKAEALIAKTGAPCWVNCSRNIWPGYQALKAELDEKGHAVEHYEVEGTDWHLGSNSIHFLAALEYIAGSPVKTVTLEPRAIVRDAKREGYREVVGTLTGETQSGATYRISSLPETDRPIVVKVKAGGHTRIIAEGKHYYFDGDSEQRPFPMLYTSQLTEPFEDLIVDKVSALPQLAESAALHLKLINELNGVFYPYEANASQNECPIT